MLQQKFSSHSDSPVCNLVFYVSTKGLQPVLTSITEHVFHLMSLRQARRQSGLEIRTDFLVLCFSKNPVLLTKLYTDTMTTVKVHFLFRIHWMPVKWCYCPPRDEVATSFSFYSLSAVRCRKKMSDEALLAKACLQETSFMLQNAYSVLLIHLYSSCKSIVCSVQHSMNTEQMQAAAAAIKFGDWCNGRCTAVRIGALW